MALTAKKVYAILNKKIEHGGATDEQIQSAITSYLDAHPEYVGATEEQALQILENKSDIENIQKTFATKEEIPKELPASDVYEWAKQPEKPEYTAEEVGALPSDTRTITKQEIDQIELNRQNLLKTAIKRTASGKIITLSDSAEMPFTEFRQYGHTTQQTTTGAQLFDASRISSVSVGGATITNNKDGSFTVYGNGVLTESIISEYRLSHDEMVKLFHPGMIKVKVEDITAPYFVVRFYDSNNSQIKNLTTEVNRNSSVDITDILDEEGTYVEMQFYLSAGKEIKSATIKPMLYQDGNGIYEPYSGGISSPSPDYPQEFVSAGDKGIVETNILGRNLFDVENAMKSQIEAGVAYINGRGELVLNGSYGSNNRAFFVTLSPGEYYLSGDEEVILHILDPQDSVWNRIINVEKETTYQCYIASGTYNNRVLHPAINLGAAPIPWEPYKQPQALTMLTPNGLPGIPVSSGGNYTDENGQQWIADYRDWERGMDVKWVYFWHYSPEEYRYSDGTNYNLFTYKSEETDYIAGTSKCFSNIFLYDSGLRTNYTLYPVIAGIRARVDGANSLDKLKELLPDGFDVLVKRKIPIETPIPADELAAYRALHTNTPTTTIVNDEDCWMEAGYAVDTKEYIDSTVEEGKIMIDTVTGKKCILGMKDGLLTVWEATE